MDAKKTEKQTYIIELIASILMGLATLLGAWAAYQSSIFDGDSANGFNEGIRMSGKANTESQKNLQNYLFDLLIWMEYRSEENQQLGYDNSEDIKNKIMRKDLLKAMQWSDVLNEETAEIYLKFYSKAQRQLSKSEINELVKEIKKEVGIAKEKALKEVYYNSNNESSADAEFFSPFSSPIYRDSLVHASDSLNTLSQTYIEEAQKNDEIADKYTFITVFCTIVLFFSGMATTVDRVSLKRVFVILSGLIFLYSLFASINVSL